jgi:hypothetical protein
MSVQGKSHFLSRITFPSYRLAAWKITDTVAFHAQGRTVALADNCYSLVVLLDLGLNFANAVAPRERGNAGVPGCHG